MNTQGQLEIVRHTTTNHLEIFLVEMTAKHLHTHSDMEIGILLQGNLTLFVDQDKYELHTGDVYLVNRNQLHSFLGPTGQNIILAFHVRTDFYRNISHQLEYLRFQQNVFSSGPIYDHIYSLLIECAVHYFKPDLFSEVKCSSLFLDALSVLLKQSPYILVNEKEYSASHNNALRIGRITSYILEHHQERISLADIAALENITTFHASHFIKHMLQISFQEYLNNVRFDHALQLIHQTNLSILDICLESGFSSSHYLNQMFIKTFGCTTKEYLTRSSKPEHIETAPPGNAIQKRYTYERSASLFDRILEQTY